MVLDLGATRVALIQVKSPLTGTTFYNPCFLARFFMPEL
ncbi:hypothetical protein PPIS_a4476 [Pseudoalteromonas piscicida]|nr:hypothetical protein PPIS_a4476 [Pseudoalteromonas piscicida]